MCVHHFLIDSKGNGVCKLCGEPKTFSTDLPTNLEPRRIDGYGIRLIMEAIAQLQNNDLEVRGVLWKLDGTATPVSWNHEKTNRYHKRMGR